MLVLMLCSQPCLTLSHPTLNSDVSALRDKLSDTKTALPLLQGPHSKLVANRVGKVPLPLQVTVDSMTSPSPHPQDQELLGTVYSPADLCHSQLTWEGIYCPGLA